MAHQRAIINAFYPHFCISYSHIVGKLWHFTEKKNFYYKNKKMDFESIMTVKYLLSF